MHIRSEEFGIARNGFTIDMFGVRDRKCRMVSGLIDVHLDSHEKSGVELILDAARFVGPKTPEATLPRRNKWSTARSQYDHWYEHALR